MSGVRHPAALPHLLAMLFLVLLAPVLTQISQGAPVASAEVGRDLAAMTLSPDDLEALGMPGFGQRTSAMLSLAEQADQAAAQVGGDAETVGAGLADAGFERRYQRELGLPRRMDGASSRLQTFVTSYIVEYASADGAAAGFALLEAEADQLAPQDVPGTRALGERSEVTRLRESTEDGEVYRALDVTLQRGDLVAGVTIGEFGGREPDLGSAEALAERLLEKIEAGEADGRPGLSNLALRIEGTGVETRSDEYGRIAGVTYPNYAETPDELAERIGRYGDAVDVYGVGQSLPAGGPARTDDVRYLILLYRFASDETAAAWLADSEARTLGSPNVIAATPVDGAATFGEESRTLALTTERSSAGLARGYSITAREGNRVAQVQLLGFPDVPLRAAEELAREQVACLQAGGCLERVMPPESLPPLAAATPFVPPADGSVAEDLCAVEPSVGGTPAAGIAAPPSTTNDQVAGDVAAPNIVLILTDDLDARSAGCMPNVRRLLAEAGASFSNAFVTTPLCCPSRASILRGQYAHNHGVLSNSGPDGGFPAFHARGDEETTIATWLQDAGYRTALFGKYLNRYPRGMAATYIPPGWDEWAAFVSSDDGDDEGGAYYSNYTLNENGGLVTYGNQPEEYSTDVLAAMGIDFVERAAASGQPFFLYLAPYAPHGPATPAPRHGEAFTGAEAPRVPSFGEMDVSDKPAWVRANREFDTDGVAQIDDRYQRRLRTLLAVDEMVAELIETLEANGALDNTVIVFASDNGFHLGEHRLPLGKQSAYDESIRVPLIVRGPGIPAGVTVSQLALNIDLAPTFAELAGVAAPDFVDGRSLGPLLRGEATAEWRQRFLVERYERKRSNGRLKVVATPVTGQTDWDGDPEEREPGISPINAPPYIALRSERYLYVDYLDGERELYDLTADPYQLQNLAASADPALLAQLAAELEELRGCVAAGCRSAGASK